MPFVSNKAVAHGAVLSHVDRDNHLVASRVARVTYGVVCSLPVKANDEEHVRRKRLWETDPAGYFYVPDYFDSKLSKVGLLWTNPWMVTQIRSYWQGAKVREDMEFRDSFSLTESNRADFGEQIVPFVCYRGNLSKPEWVDQDACESLTFLDLRHPSDTDNCSIFLYVLSYPRRPKRACQGSSSEEEGVRPGLLPTGLRCGRIFWTHRT